MKRATVVSAEQRRAPARQSRPGALAMGLIAIMVAVFMLPSSTRSLVTAMTWTRFAQDQLRLESFEDPLGRSVSGTVVSGQIVSSGEPFRTKRTSLVGLDRLRELSSAGAIPGHLVPVYYLSPDRFWSAIDLVVGFRVQSREEFESGLPIGYLAANIALVLASIWLIRRGIGRSRG